MNINKNNYEAFFLDYHEGNLSPQEVAELLLFVEQHPELREEFESFENITLYDLSAVSFENKDILKKKITEENREEYFIRSVEGSLTAEEKNLLNEFLKQHPQYIAELELFGKTILSPDISIVFENKAELKRAVITTSVDELLIASVEGLLTGEEEKMLKQQLLIDAELANEYSLYQQTKLSADISVVYENKEELKRDKKVVPFFWYISGVAAAILLLIGLFFIFTANNHKTGDQNFAQEKEDAGTKDQNLVPSPHMTSVPNENNSAQFSALNVSVVKKNSKEHKKDSAVVNPLIHNEEPVNVANNEPKNQQQPELNKNDEPVIANNNEKPEVNKEAPVFANNETNSTTKKSANDYLTLREFAAEKIKEKALDQNSVAAQKQTGRLKRFSGWDVAQIITRGVSKLTGRDLEVKPKYNEEGEVTAYALGNAFEVSRGK